MSRELEERVAFAEMARDTAITKAEAQVAKYKAKCEVAGKKIAELMAENKLLRERITAAQTISDYGDGPLFNLDH